LDYSEKQLNRLVDMMRDRWDLESVERERLADLTDQSVIDYYSSTSEAEYRRFISADGACHYGLTSPDRIERPQDMYAHADTVATHMAALNAEDVLEVGCGKALNLRYLAERHPQVQFHGTDVTPLHLHLARERTQHLSNVEIMDGDHRDLPLPDASVDVIYAIETLCYLDTAEKLSAFFNHAARVLRPNGRLVVFDFYRADAFSKEPPSSRYAVTIVETAFVISEFARTKDFENIAASQGLPSTERRNFNAAVLPMIVRLHNFVRIYLTRLYLIKRVKYMLENVLGRQLDERHRQFKQMNKAHLVVLPYVLNSGSLEYNLVVLEKQHAPSG
jgi:ubiquinone/menaquinone biosynthesis C-methylase UbiE